MLFDYVAKESVVINTVGEKYKLPFEESVVIGTDDDTSEVIIPIICDKCEHRIFHKDKLVTTETHKRQMGNEMFHANCNTDFDCPRCKSQIHIVVEISEYAYNFMFFNFENENCKFSHVYDLKTLDD